MIKYLFITYGQAGWRGVQMRALRIANYFNKSEVLFWNLYDSSLIEEWGFAVENKPSGLVLSNDIVFPKETEVVIFADIPTNEFFQYSVYQAAIQKKIKIVICDQLYRREQMKEGVFKMLAENCDLFLLNSLSFLNNESNSNIKILPPQIEHNFKKKDKNYICQKYGIPLNATILFGSGYHPRLYKKIKLFTQRLSVYYKQFYTIVSAPKSLQKVKKEGHLITIPFVNGEEYFKLLYAVDIVLVKFGFLQILESLALNKPTVVLGEAGKLLQDKSVIDPTLRRALKLNLKNDDELFNYLKKLVIDQSYRKKVIQENKKLHNGVFFGAKKAASEIKKLVENKQFLRKIYPNKIAILINQEIFEYKQWLAEEKNIYPLCILWSMPNGLEVIKRLPKPLLNKTVKDFQIKQKDEILPHSFKNIFIFSPRKYDGFTSIPSWYNHWLEQIHSSILKADEIYISKDGLKIFNGMLNSFKDRLKLLDNKIKITNDSFSNYSSL
ncbi:MAG: hypothetical protein HYW86_05205 [Candidatus Roizmanbacteria bacterium]|nr:MAG: hypothetical protein HYW86_05205 [Candidatus Roizmanbacteria bacterium]